MMVVYDGHSRICWLKVIVAYGNLISQKDPKFMLVQKCDLFNAAAIDK